MDTSLTGDSVCAQERARGRPLIVDSPAWLAHLADERGNALLVPTAGGRPADRAILPPPRDRDAPMLSRA
jgi:hypothetical protein